MVSPDIELRAEISLFTNYHVVNEMTSDDWNNLIKFDSILQTFDKYSNLLQTSTLPTIHLSIAIYNKIYDLLDDLVKSTLFSKAAIAARLKWHKYYKLSDMVPSHILNTMYKYQYFISNEWEDSVISSVDKMLHFNSFIYILID